jgi:hypothetical protein
MLIQDLSSQKRKTFLSLVKKRVQPGSGSSLSFLHKRTWSYCVSNLNLILKKAPFVIVGGVATRLYMPERMTLDLAILIKAEDARKIYQDLEIAGGQKIGKLNIPGSQWQLPDNSSLKVLEADDEWVTEAVSKPNYAPDGLPIIDLSYLILMKLSASRTQDLADVSRMLGLADESNLTRIKSVVKAYLSTAMEDLESLILLGKLEIGK